MEYKAVKLHEICPKISDFFVYLQLMLSLTDAVPYKKTFSYKNNKTLSLNDKHNKIIILIIYTICKTTDSHFTFTLGYCNV